MASCPCPLIMRSIGEISNKSDAKLFGDYLYVKGVANDIDEEDGKWTVWVHNDDQLDAASAALEKFLADPTNAAFRKKGAKADQLRKQEAIEDSMARQRQVDVRTQVFSKSGLRTPHLTYGLIGLCIIVHLATLAGSKPNLLIISGYGPTQTIQTKNTRTGEVVREETEWAFLVEITGDKVLVGKNEYKTVGQGQLWRLVTPIFIHFGFLHIIFNMMWLHRLGGEFEGRLGTGWFVVFLLVTATISNLAQYGISLPPLFQHGPTFGGMSGVVYGLAGHAWIRGRQDPRSGIELDESTFTFLMIWFFLCFLPFMPIANTAHTFGLLVGLAWGWIAVRRAR